MTGRLGLAPDLCHRDRAPCEQLRQEPGRSRTPRRASPTLLLLFNVGQKLACGTLKAVAPYDALRREIVFGEKFLNRRVFEAAAIGADVTGHPH